MKYTENSFGSKDPVFRKEAHEYKTLSQQEEIKRAFDERARAITLQHFEQTPEDVLLLRDRYKKAVFGEMSISDALRKLSECVDATDTELYCTNQMIHCLQVAEGMEKDGIKDETLILAALVHDMGKLAEFGGAKPHLVNCPNEPVGTNKPGCGLDNTIITWNHDEFAYQRIRDYVPEHVSWLVRYHSLRFDKAEQFMDEKDRKYHDSYLSLFRKYDLGTKSVFHLPEKKVADYEPLLNKYFPQKIVI